MFLVASNYFYSLSFLSQVEAEVASFSSTSCFETMLYTANET